MEPKPKFKVDLKEKRLYFNGNSIELNQSLYDTKIIQPENKPIGIRLNYNEDKSFNLTYETIRLSSFLKENKLEKALAIQKYNFPNNSIIITKRNF